MTEMLHMTDSYEKKTKAIIKEVGKDGQGYFFITDKTVFYPESGGQDSDNGFGIMNNKKIKIVKALKRSGNVIHYTKEKIEVKPGDKILLKIDWERRYNLMKMHTAQHIISRVVLNMFNSETVGNQIHPNIARIDFRPANFSDEDLKIIENESNKIADNEIEIKIEKVTREEAEQSGEYRVNFSLLPPSIKILRVVNIKGFDKAICAGTHVSNTKEVGHFKILKKENKGQKTQRIIYELI